MNPGSLRIGWRAVAGIVLALAALPAVHAQGIDAEQIVLHGNGRGAHACASCHGNHAEGNQLAGIPHLAGLPDAYLARQLTHFQAQARDNPSMQVIAHTLTPDEITALARHFAALPPPLTPPADALPPPLGVAMAEQGRGAVPACATCHGPGGVGLGATFPPLAGQSALYIRRQLEAWQQGKRPPGPLGMMGAIARCLTASEMAAVSLYYEQQPTAPVAVGEAGTP